MAQLLLISARTLRPGINEVGDIVGVFDDKHVFSQAEIDGFDIKSIEGEQEKVFGELQVMKPDTKDLTEEEMKEQVSIPKYPFSISDDSKATVAEACVCKIVVTPPKIKDIIG